MRTSLTSRLYFGFSVAVLLILVTGYVSYKTVHNQAVSQQRVKHSYEVINTIKTIQVTIPKMRSSVKNYLLTGEERFKLPFLQGLTSIFKQTDDLKRLVIDNPQQTERADSVIYGVKSLVFFWEAIKITDTTTKAYRTSLMMAEESKIDYVNNLTERLYSTELHLLSQRQEEDETASKTSVEVLIASITLVLLIVFVLIYIILNEFNRRTEAEDNLKRSIEEISTLNDHTGKKNWELTGIAKINSSLQGAEGMAALMLSTLSSLLEYSGLPAAAFYAFDEETKLLELKSAVGATIKYKTSYHPYQIPGGLNPEKKVSVLNSVPDNFWSIQSGFGGSLPREIAIVALYLGKELKGIIEIASFGKFLPEQLDLFMSVSQYIAVTINAAQAREQIMLLLRQVQDQKEALENQQEELRQSNEELLRQTEILQASEEELKVQEEELRHINTELEEKNEAVETARQALLIKAKELDEISKYKSEFLANMSHELRTPLNSVLILANLLADNKNNNLTGKQVEYANIIHKSGTDLLNLINDILDLSKIEAGKLNIHIEEVAIIDIVNDILPSFTVLADNKKISFVAEVEENVPEHITTDRLRLEQIIKNLLSNAFKFTEKGGDISLKFSLVKSKPALAGSKKPFAEHELSISVKDTGTGIPQDKQHIIFEAFQQGDGSINRKFGGTGLGLSISGELVRMLGGEITVASEPGIGSIFTIYIPLHISAQALKPGKLIINPPPPSKKITNFQPVMVDDRGDIEQNDKVMLIIEDDEKFAAVLQSFARDRNYKTIVATRGDEGLKYANKYIPTAIILDIQLPVMDGWTVLKELKGTKALKHIPVHIISVVEGSDGKEEGAIAFLKKPVSKEGLEKAFADIAGYLQSNFKKLLFFSGEAEKNTALKELLDERKMDITCTYINTLPEAAEALKQNKYDCMIVDMGEQITKGIEELQELKRLGVMDELQVIVCLDKDISKEDEWKLKKFSSVVIRDSAKAKQRLTDELELFLNKVNQTQIKQFAPGSTVEDDDFFAGKKVLIVDDDMRNVFALNIALEEQKMVVCTANDGKEALEVLKNNPDTAIVLMDIMMPEMDGYEAIKHIRKDMLLVKLPIIALTAKAMQGDREKSIEAGASDYITKPVDKNRLLSLMRVWLSQ